MLPVRRTISLVILLTLIFSACADKIKTDLVAFKALDESLVNSNTIINNESKQIYQSLEDKLSDPATADKAREWYPKAKEVEKLSQDMYVYIEGLKSDLKKEAGLKTGENGESFKESDKNSVMRLFNKERKGDELYDHLKKYKQDVLTLDPQMSSTFSNSLQITTKSFESSKSEQGDFAKTFFDDIPTIAALAMLSKFQNNVRVIENRTASFCHNRTNTVAIVEEWHTALVTQNIKRARAGESIEITAGVGSFISSFKTEVIISGKKVPVGEGGVAMYKFNASNKPGKYVVPVEINFTDQDGKKQTITKNIEYTVAN